MNEELHTCCQCGNKEESEGDFYNRCEHCDGRYYNFKKGFEICKYRESCNYFKYYQTLEETKQPTYEMPSVIHQNIREFRMCKRFDNPELLSENQ